MRPGDRVTFIGASRPEFVEVLYAAAKARAIFIAVNKRLAAREVLDILADAEPRMLIVGGWPQPWSRTSGAAASTAVSWSPTLRCPRPSFSAGPGTAWPTSSARPASRLPLAGPHRLRQAPEAGHQGKPDHPRRPLAPLSPVGSVPENGPAGGARTRLVVPGVLRVRAVGSAWRLGRNLVGVREWRLRGNSGWRAVRRRRPSGLRRSGSRFGFRRGGISHVVPQGRPDDLQAPVRTGPLGELRPRQHSVYPRHVFLGDGNPEHDGDAGCIRQPGTRHVFKVPRTARLEHEGLRVEPAKNNQAKDVRWAKDCVLGD